MGNNQDEDTGEIWQPENPTDFKVYDVPTEIKNDYISMAKLMYDDDVWKVMAEAMASLKDDKFGRVEVLEKRISNLEEEIGALKALIGQYKEDGNLEEDELKPTLGGEN